MMGQPRLSVASRQGIIDPAGGKMGIGSQVMQPQDIIP
jgi:hypothetical protein